MNIYIDHLHWSHLINTNKEKLGHAWVLNIKHYFL